ncbi:MAG: DUF3501 family protein [Actinomycetota bacterium]|nr:DUF3501 family protein [Actinomycetota bacterium]
MSQRLSREALVLDGRAYASQRPARRAAMIALRRDRRVPLGDQLSLEFENAQTLQYQVQEMLYVEFTGQAAPSEAEVSEELAAYSRLLPGSHELCATLLIELEDPATVRDDLARLAGVHHALSIDVGPHTVRGVELPGRDEPTDRELPTVSVHTVRFRFDDAARDAFRDPSVPARVVVDHPQYAADAQLTGVTRMSLLADLTLVSGEPSQATTENQV